MEKNIIVLDVETYNKLHDSFIAMEAKGFYVSNYNSSWRSVFSNVEALKVLNDENTKLKENYEKLNVLHENYKLYNPEKTKEKEQVYTIPELKQLSIINFLKLKFKKS